MLETSETMFAIKYLLLCTLLSKKFVNQCFWGGVRAESFSHLPKAQSLAESEQHECTSPVTSKIHVGDR